MHTRMCASKCSSKIFMSLSPFVLDTISKTLRAGGNVLLPVDTAGRVLELLLILEDVSRRNRDGSFVSLVNYFMIIKVNSL